MNNLPCIQEQVGCRAYWNPDFLPSAHQSSSSALEVGFLHYRAGWGLIREEWAPAETCFLLSSLYSQPPLSERSRSVKNVSWYPNSMPYCGQQPTPFLGLQLSLSAHSVQFSSVAQSCPTLCDPHGLQHVEPPCPSPIPRVYSNSVSIESVMPSNHLILHHPLLIPPSIFPSIRVFSNGLLLFFCLN